MFADSPQIFNERDAAPVGVAAPAEEAKAEEHGSAGEEPKAGEPTPAVGQLLAAEAAPAVAEAADLELWPLWAVAAVLEDLIGQGVVRGDIDAEPVLS